MLLFGHPGITLGAATVLADAAERKPTWFMALARRLDIRWLLVGSLLPDIIDKPVGQLFFRDTFNNGRIFAHSLLFLVVIALAGFLLYRQKRQTWLLALAAGTFAHLVLDEMWQTPQTLCWPLMGVAFPGVNLENWAGNIWQALLHDPHVYIPEIVGLAVLLVLLGRLIRKKKFWSFLKHGEVA